MVNFAKPQSTKSRIKSAGKRISKSKGTLEDTLVLENFRASHAYVLNTFQMNARRHSAGFERTVGQRLKRRNTIIDKLGREPSMPLYAMQDIAGCRIIFENEADLYTVRQSMREARFKHLRVNDPDRYDYIKHPKTTGYRGVHDVFEYKVDKLPGSQWDGLKVEVQYRTRVQHAWATAVEVADLITSSRIKFNDAGKTYLRYFQLASEILARTHEGEKSCLPGMSEIDLRDEFRSADMRLGLLSTFERLKNTSEKSKSFRKNTLLIFRFDRSEEEERLEVRTFENVNRAIEEYDSLEKEIGNAADIVLVRGDSEESIRDAFRNYFSDARAFVDLVQDGMDKLSPAKKSRRLPRNSRKAAR